MMLQVFFKENELTAAQETGDVTRSTYLTLRRRHHFEYQDIRKFQQTKIGVQRSEPISSDATFASIAHL
jgi:hypothetical protein